MMEIAQEKFRSELSRDHCSIDPEKPCRDPQGRSVFRISLRYPSVQVCHRGNSAGRQVDAPAHSNEIRRQPSPA
jgi:hypothetical protein